MTGLYIIFACMVAVVLWFPVWALWQLICVYREASNQERQPE